VGLAARRDACAGTQSGSGAVTRANPRLRAPDSRLAGLRAIRRAQALRLQPEAIAGAGGRICGRGRIPPTYGAKGGARTSDGRGATCAGRSEPCMVANGGTARRVGSSGGSRARQREGGVAALA